MVAAAYIGVHKGLGHSGDVIQRDAQVAVGVGVDAQLVQPVLAHPAQDRDAVVGVRAGNTHQPAVKGCHAQATAVVGIVEALDVVRGVLLVHIGHVIGQAVVHHLDKGVVADDGHDVGQFARGDAGGQLVGESVAACFKAVHQIHVELGFNVTGVGVVFKSLAFREQGSGRRFRKTAQGDGQGVHIGSVFVLGHGDSSPPPQAVSAVSAQATVVAFKNDLREIFLMIKSSTMFSQIFRNSFFVCSIQDTKNKSSSSLYMSRSDRLRSVSF